jgi:ketosteroid isomerase-like protein
MSQENMELARRVPGDFQALLELLSDDVVWDNAHFGAAVPLDHEGVVRGKRDVSRLLRSWVSTWQDFRFDAEEIIDAGDAVVVVIRETGRGRTSGLPMENRYCQVWTFRDGRIVSATIHRQKRDALKAVGLEE